MFVSKLRMVLFIYSVSYPFIPHLSRASQVSEMTKVNQAHLQPSRNFREEHTRGQCTGPPGEREVQTLNECLKEKTRIQFGPESLADTNIWRTEQGFSGRGNTMGKGGEGESLAWVGEGGKCLATGWGDSRL